ncbi:hypothetical protein JTE90_027591 [Oedothorax gibbosus]|uniref:C2H2-type domain-containing protein n=1 Tax=Oedothorax gibbosus TaxID=931172 RepID=A0AAV6VJT5_9ARAC|nr:hypothetical protein JTE90_027591 [Oedothorax gibbosus]
MNPLPSLPAFQTFECSKCRQKFTHKHHLIRHIEAKHSEVREVYTCKICGITQARQDHLRQHMRLKHNIIPPKKCTFDSSRSQLRVFKCTQCPREFNYKHCLVRHEALHKEVREVYSCEICGITKTRRDHLREHLAMQHNVSFQAPQIQADCHSVTSVLIALENSTINIVLSDTQPCIKKLGHRSSRSPTIFIKRMSSLQKILFQLPDHEASFKMPPRPQGNVHLPYLFQKFYSQR